MLGKGIQLKPSALLVFSLVSKVFEKLVNNKLVNHLEKCDLFSNFQYGFRSSQSTAGLLTVVSDGVPRAFDRVWHAGLLHKVSFMEFSVRYLALFPFFSVMWF